MECTTGRGGNGGAQGQHLGAVVAAGSGWQQRGTATKAAAAGLSFCNFYKKLDLGVVGKGQKRKAGSKITHRKSSHT